MKYTEDSPKGFRAAGGRNRKQPGGACIGGRRD